jgi:hypothetical protein
VGGYLQHKVDVSVINHVCQGKERGGDKDVVGDGIHKNKEH